MIIGYNDEWYGVFQLFGWSLYIGTATLNMKLGFCFSFFLNFIFYFKNRFIFAVY